MTDKAGKYLPNKIFLFKDADIIVSVGGCRESYRETHEQSFDRNIDDIMSAAMHLIEFNHKAIFCIAKPPIEAFVPLVSEVSKFLKHSIQGVSN